MTDTMVKELLELLDDTDVEELREEVESYGYKSIVNLDVQSAIELPPSTVKLVLCAFLVTEFKVKLSLQSCAHGPFSVKNVSDVMNCGDLRSQHRVLRALESGGRTYGQDFVRGGQV